MYWFNQIIFCSSKTAHPVYFLTSPCSWSPMLVSLSSVVLPFSFIHDPHRSSGAVHLLLWCCSLCARFHARMLVFLTLQIVHLTMLITLPNHTLYFMTYCITPNIILLCLGMLPVFVLGCNHHSSHTAILVTVAIRTWCGSLWPLLLLMFWFKWTIMWFHMLSILLSNLLSLYLVLVIIGCIINEDL